MAAIRKDQAHHEIGVGDRVRNATTKEYLGTVTDIETLTVYTIRDRKRDERVVLGTDLIELAQPLTPEGAWARVPILAMEGLKGWNGAMPRTQYPQIRHQCYQTLGAAGVKVDDGVKRRVRELVENVADILGVDLIE